MFDALAKLPPGISQGNINWMGSYETCVDIKEANVSNFPLNGKYCRADISFPIEQFVGDLPIYDVSLAYGICISRFCNTYDVASIVSNCITNYFSLRSLNCI